MNHPVAFAAGARLGPYKILSPLGAGGMGEVYRARDTRLDRVVAIKVLPGGGAADPGCKARLIHEARAASALNHPNIVAIYDVAREGETDYLVMECADGHTLDQLIPRKGMRVPEVLRLATQAADALAAAHATGIVHRDFKPSNIVIGPRGLLKVLDFGVAKVAPGKPDNCDATRSLAGPAPPHTAEGTIVGTAAYMSPEQAEGKPVDARSDIFSFGVVLYEMLTGNRPFQGDTAISTLSAILRDEPPPLRQVADGVPAEIDRIVNRCLRKDAARRFQHTADLKIALDELKQESDSGALAAALPSAATPRRGRWSRAGVAAALAVSAGAALLAWRGHKEDDEPLTPVPLTSYAGAQSGGAFSPDGDQVVFAWRREGEAHSHIYVKLVGPGPPLQLTHGDAGDYGPAWSPDGVSIAFLRYMDSKTALILMPALGGAERKVTEWVGPSSLSWSPDGQWLLYYRRDPITSPSAIFATSPTTGATRRLTTPTTAANFGDMAPAVTPDGRALAFARNVSGIGSIHMLDLSPGLEPRDQSRAIITQDQDIRSLAWTPDGRDIVYSVGLAHPALWRVPASGGKPHRLPGLATGTAPSLSRPRGPRLLPRLLALQVSADENVWKLPFPGGRAGEPVRILDSTRRDFEPRVSPDGKRLAFSSDRSGWNEVWLAEADGSGATQLTFLRAQTTAGARWSPDGRRLVFVSTAPGQQEIFVMDVGGGAPVRVTNHPAHDTAPNWSRDGQWIYFASNRTGRFEIWKSRPEPNAPATQVTHHGGYAAIESPDGATLFYAQRSGSQGIWQMPVAGGPETLVLPAVSTWGDFDVTRTGIVFIDPSGRTLRLYRFDTSRSATLADLPRPAGFGLSIAGDGTIFYSLIDHESSELVLLDNFH